MEKITVHIDTKLYHSKPKVSEIGQISNRITEKTYSVTAKELALKIKQGYTILPSLMHSKRSIKNFKESQVIFLDFDNSYKENGEYKKLDNYISFEKMKQDKFIQKNASFIYSTFSNSDEINRYRVVFVLDKIITDYKNLQKIINYLLIKFPTADKSCRDISRLFFSGHDVTEINFDNSLKVSEILDYSLLNIQKDSLVKIPEQINCTGLHHNKIKDFTDRHRFNTSVNETPLIKLLKENNISAYRDKVLPLLDIDFSLVKTKKDFVYLINSLDLSILLGIPNHNQFNCVLTEDNHPSASIFKVDNGNFYLYKRFGDNGFVLNVLDVFKVLLHTNSNDKIIDFFKRVFNITYAVPENLTDISFGIQKFLDFLQNETELQQYSSTHKILGKHRSIIIDYFKIILNEPFWDAEKEEIRYLTLKSTKSLSNLLFGNIRQNKLDKINRLINLLTYLGLINKLSEIDYPKDTLNYLKSQRNIKGYEYLQSIIEINYRVFTKYDELLRNLEEVCSFLLSKGYTFKGFTQDFISITDSISASNHVYKQSQNKKISTHQLKMYTYIENKLKNHFSENNYMLLSDLKNECLKKFSKNQVKINFNVSLNMVMSNLSLQKKKASNSIKSEFDIQVDADDFPYIIINV